MTMKVVESTMVKPSSETPTTTMWISNLDVQMPSDHTLILYFYRGGAVDFFDAAVLKAALSRALVEFYPYAGRLKKGNDRIEIDCNGEGVLFVEAEADGDMDDLGDDFAPKADVSFIPEVDYSKGISSYPLFLVQMTRFKCGGVCLGIANEHHVSDGFSAIHFINTWSNIARGGGIKVPPFFDRTILRAGDSPEPKFAHIEYHPPPPLVQTPETNNPNLKFTVFKLTLDQLNALKTSCSKEEDQNYSTYEVVSGHLWRCVTAARGLPKNQETKLHIPIDGRSRLRPPLPPGYFGNVVFTAAPVASCGELIKSVRFAAGKIHEAVRRMDDVYLRSALDYLELELQAQGASSPYKCPNLGIISWARLPFYDADFGWGKPVYFGLGATPSEGIIIVLPSPANDGGLMCAISMPEEQINIFKKLFYDI